MIKPTMLAGADPEESLDDVLDRVSRQPAWRPFDERAVTFVGRLSRRLLTHGRVREFPELAALGHWFRPARLEAMRSERASSATKQMRRGRGLAFHLAPANVDSVSMYSWLLSLLAGNVNVVRVSQRMGNQLQFFLDVLREVASESESGGVASRIIILTYPHDAATTRAVSERCHLRVVWGGDNTVATIRAIPLRPTAVELAFPDRFSLAALNASSVLGLDEMALEKLARGFFNDAYWFSQQACSSPRVVYWIGPAVACESARQRFWAAVGAEVSRRQPEDTSAMAMDRLAVAFELAGGELASPADGAAVLGVPARLTLERGLLPTVKDLHCGNGLFLEDTLSSLSELALYVTDREQTLSVFGFDRETLSDLLDVLPPRALDRIVPIGTALEFSANWDGIDLLDAFSRKIELVGL